MRLVEVVVIGQLTRSRDEFIRHELQPFVNIQYVYLVEVPISPLMALASYR